MPAAFANFCERFDAFPMLGMVTFATNKAVFPFIMGEVGLSPFSRAEGLREFSGSVLGIVQTLSIKISI